MASNTTSVESRSPYEILKTNPDKDQRRKAALSLFKDYLLPDHGILAMQSMGYSEAQIQYVSEAVDHLALTPSVTNNGLEGRSGRENGSASRPSIVDSSAIGIGEFMLGLPGNLSWIARDRMSAEECRDLEQTGTLMRITAVDPALLSDDHDDRLVKILHARDQFPGIGLRSESLIANIARKIGKGATYAVERANGLSDVQISLQVPGSKSVIERWRELPTNDTGLHFFGRVPRV
jgi:hypothetical protein